MLNFPLWKRVLILGICVLGILIALPNAFYGRVERANDARAAMAAGARRDAGADGGRGGWPRWLPSRLINLGLDLRGGAHVLVQVRDRRGLCRAASRGCGPPLRDRLRDLRDQVGTVRRLDGPPDELHIRSASPAGMDAALEAVAAAAQPVFSITGGASREFEVARRGRHAGRDADRRPRRRRSTRARCSRASRSSAAASTRPAPASRRSSARAPTASWCRCRASARPRSCSQVIGKTAQLSFHPVVNRTTDAERPAGPRRGGLPVDGRAGRLLRARAPRGGHRRPARRQPADLRPERPAGGQLPLQPGRRRRLRRLHRREHRQALRHRARQRR